MAGQNRDVGANEWRTIMRGILKHDMYAGIYRQTAKILVFGMVFVIAAFMGMSQAKIWGIHHLSFYENLTYIFMGCIPFYQSGGLSFTMPILWMIIQLYLAYIIGSYPLQDLESYGINLLLRTKSRWKWWIGKVVWVVSINFILYAVAYFMVFILTKAMQGEIAELRPETAVLYQADFSRLDSSQLQMVLFLFPVLTSLTVSLLQIAIMFIFNEVTAYGTIGFLCVAGAFYETPFFIVSNAMALRSFNLILSGIYNKVLAGEILLMFLAIVAGAVIMRKKNVYGS